MNLEERISNIRFQHEEDESISEELVKEIIRKLIFEHSLRLIPDILTYCIIKHTKCDYHHALAIKKKMSDLGMDVCMEFDYYSIEKFAEMRDYVTGEELEKVYKEIDDEEKKQKEIERYFEEKYGENWSDEVWDEYHAAGGI
ncbi:MAG: hypothetical protein ACT4N5_07520 [Nitrosopumilaceae archaeon]